MTLLMMGGGVHAQSLFDSADGKGSISLPAGGRFDFNFTEQLANFTITTSTFAKLKLRTTGTPADEAETIVRLSASTKALSQERLGQFKRFAFSMRAKPEGNVANLFGSNHPGVGAGLTVSYGISRMASFIESQADGAIRSALFTSLDDMSVPPLGKTRQILSLDAIKEEGNSKRAELKKQIIGFLKTRNLLKALPSPPDLAKIAQTPEAIDLIKIEKEFHYPWGDDLVSFTKDSASVGDKIAEKQVENALISQRVSQAAGRVADAQTKYDTAKKESDTLKTDEAKEKKQVAKAALDAAILEKVHLDARRMALPGEIELLEKQKVIMDSTGNPDESTIQKWTEKVVYSLYATREDRIKGLERQKELFAAESNKLPQLDDAITTLKQGKTYSRDGVIRLKPSQNITGKFDYDHLDFRLGFDYDRFQLADVDKDGKATNITTKSTDGFNFQVAYNLEWNNKKHFDLKGKPQYASPFLLGIAGGYGKISNKSDLSPITGSDALPRAEFDETDTWHLNTDLAYSPGALDNRVWINLFTRNNFGSGANDRYGVGAFFTEKDNSFKSIGGVAVAYDTQVKLRVDIVAGFNF